MSINGRTVVGGLFLIIGICIETSLSQVNCKNYTLVLLSGATPKQGSTTNNVTRSNCESSCLSDAVCNGFTWTNSQCTVNQQSNDSLSYDSSPEVSYYSLIRGYSDCNVARYCSYSWSGVKNQHASGGNRNNVTNLNDCVKSCQDSNSCGAVDWNTVEKSCWVHVNSYNELYPSNDIYYFNKSCLIPSTLPFPTTTATSVSISGSTTTTTITVLTSSSSRPGTPVASSSSSTIPTSTTTIPTTTTTTSTTTTATATISTAKPSSSSAFSSVSIFSSSSFSSSSASASASASTFSSSSASFSSSSSSSSSFPTSSSSSFVPPTSSIASTVSTTASPCKNVTCGRGQECTVKGASWTPSCVCYTVCPAVYSPVCGNDSITYGNQCSLDSAACKANITIMTVRNGPCNSEPPFQSEIGREYADYPMAIKPAYVVLAGLGGGCLLLVLTAVIILCQYPLNGAETYSSNGTLVNGAHRYASQGIDMEAVGEGGGQENVEFNPYYNRSELEAPDFTKEENIM